MRYSISTQLDHHPATVQTRQRRDSAELIFRREVYAALHANGLLDRPVAHERMAEAERANDPTCDLVQVRVRETVITFRRAA